VTYSHDVAGHYSKKHVERRDTDDGVEIDSSARGDQYTSKTDGMERRD
jgi:hypothetical protein